MLSIIWITRQSQTEDNWLREAIRQVQQIKEERLLIEVILVGPTEIEETDGLHVVVTPTYWDQMGNICHKKNLGVLRAHGDLCLVCHADVLIPISTLLWLCRKREKLVRKFCHGQKVGTGLGFLKQDRTKRCITWASLGQGDRWKEHNEKQNQDTYISGACLIASRQLLIDNPWNELLGHNRAEDVEFSTRLKKAGVKLVCLSSLILYMHNTQ